MAETIAERLITLLDEKGILPADTIVESLEITKQSLYSAVHAWNRKGAAPKIISVGFKYRLLRRRTNVPAVSDEKSMDLPNEKNEKIPFQASMIKKLKALPAEDLNDCLDMLKKSEFYKKSAIALIEVNEGISMLRQSLLQGEL